MPLPSNLSLNLAAVDGAAPVSVIRDVGSSGNANDEQVNSQRRVWHVEIPEDGDYRAVARADFGGIGINAQLWLGHGPPLPGVLVPFVAAGLVLLGGFFWFVIRPRLRARTTQRATGQ